MTRIARRPWLKWTLRALLALAACEATLAIGASVIEERGGGGGRSIPDGCIVCVGDSHTQGVGASPGRSYPDQLQELLRAAGDPRPVVNLGVAGFDSRLIVDKLEDALADGKPSCVLYLAGNNDLTSSLSLLDLGSAAEAGASDRMSSRLDGVLSCLRTWRMARAAWHVATGDLARHEIGGAVARRLPPPQAVHPRDFDAEYARARADGATALAEWLEQFWYLEDVTRMRATWDELQATPGVERLLTCLRQPVDAYAWELDALERGEWRAPPAALHNPHENRAFLFSSRALAAWSAGGGVEALRAELERPEVTDWLCKANPWSTAFMELHRGYALLLAREWKQAATTLKAALHRSSSISPRVAWPYLHGGAALAELFAGSGDAPAEIFADAGDAPAGDAPATTPRYRDPGAWHIAYWSHDLPTGREWMAVAEIAEGARIGLGSDAHKAGRRRARERFPAPRTRPLRWLHDHPDATFEQIRDELPLEPPRASWWGIRRFLFRNVDGDEFRKLAAVQHERLATLARRDSFDVVVLSYVFQDMPMFNDVQRELAAQQGFELADVHSRFTRAELEADDRKRYFSPDRAHPNDDGYALMAREAFEALQRLRSGSGQ